MLRTVEKVRGLEVSVLTWTGGGRCASSILGCSWKRSEGVLSSLFIPSSILFLIAFSRWTETEMKGNKDRVLWWESKICRRRRKECAWGTESIPFIKGWKRESRMLFREDVWHEAKSQLSIRERAQRQQTELVTTGWIRASLLGFIHGAKDCGGGTLRAGGLRKGCWPGFVGNIDAINASVRSTVFYCLSSQIWGHSTAACPWPEAECIHYYHHRSCCFIFHMVPA